VFSFGPLTRRKTLKCSSTFKEDFLTLYNYLKGGCSEVAFSLFTQAASDGARGNGLKLCLGRLGTRKNLFIEKVLKHWHWLPREVFTLPSLEVFKRHVDVVLRGMV